MLDPFLHHQMRGEYTMQELFNLFYLYDYMVMHTVDEEKEEYICLRRYVARLIEGMGTE